MFERINRIVQAETSDLRELAEAAGANYKTFWRGADFEGVDLRGQDLRDFDLGDASLKGAIIDGATRLPGGMSANAAGARKVAGPVEPPPASMSSRVAPHIPYLRRHARAVSGSQATGDAYVATVLEALISDPFPLGEEGGERISLYKLFSKLWRIAEEVEDVHPLPSKDVGKPILQILPPRPRQAFLLATVEGFHPEQIALILQVEREEVISLLDQAATFIGERLSTSVMIIEDEPLIALDLEEIVESLGHRVTGVAGTQREAVALFKEHEPGIVLADLQLGDGSSGLDAVNDILAIRSVPVVFITAFPERLLTGKRPEPCYLVTKPFQLGPTKAIITQAALSQSGVDGWMYPPDRADAG